MAQLTSPVPPLRIATAPWHLRLLGALSAYLPMLIMAVLALGTWWLVKNTPLPEVAGEAAPLRHEPDYTMHQFSVLRFAKQGTLRAQIDGDVLRHYPDTDTLEIDNARIKSYAPDGRITHASARRALSNGDGSEVQLLGGAQVLREATATQDAIEFRGEFLHAFLTTERVRSHLPVTVLRGSSELHAAAMDYDNLSQVLDLKGPMRATFTPPKARR